MRTVFQSFLVALEMLRLHKLRALLTMIGVIIGVFAVTVIVMIMNGFQAYLDKQFKEMGSNAIYIAFDPGMRARREGRGIVEGLRMDDVQFLRDRLPEVIENVSPVASAPASKITFGDREMTGIDPAGVDENYAEVAGEEVTLGRNISASDTLLRANVVVIGNEVAERLFPNEPALGKYVTLPGITLQVIGVLKRKDVFGQSNGKDLRIPLTTVMDKWTGNKNLMMITTKPKEGVMLSTALDRTWQTLMLRSNNRKIYRVDSSETMSMVLGGILGAAGAILAAVAALSLLVGGIGIMNIMLVSVTERTKEIGLRKAVGARSGNILGQFLVESATLGLIGGLIGMAVAYGLGLIVGALTAQRNFPMEGGLPISFPLYAAIGAAAFSAAIGMVFGLFPAVSASRLDPIVALRRE